MLQVSGEIDLATVPSFRDHLTRIIAHPGATVLVDLDGVTALDDTGLGMLLGAAGRAREQSGDLVVVCIRRATAAAVRDHRARPSRARAAAAV